MAKKQACSKEWFLLFDYALSQIVIGGSGNDYRDNVISISKWYVVISITFKCAGTSLVRWPCKIVISDVGDEMTYSLQRQRNHGHGLQATAGPRPPTIRAATVTSIHVWASWGVLLNWAYQYQQNAFNASILRSMSALRSLQISEVRIFKDVRTFTCLVS